MRFLDDWVIIAEISIKTFNKSTKENLFKNSQKIKIKDVKEIWQQKKLI